VIENIKHPHISIVLPAHKKAKVLSETLKRLYAELDLVVDNHYEVIVVIDGKHDESEKILKALRLKNLKSIIYEENKGKGYAIRKGWEISSGDFIGYLDCDLDIHPSAIHYAERLLSNDSQIAGVIGSKKMSREEANYPVFRKIMSHIYSWLAGTLLHLKVRDTQTGFKLFRYAEAKYLMRESSMNGFAWDLEICAIAAERGLLIEEIPIILNQKNSDVSSVRIQTAMRAVFDIMLIRRRIKKLK